MDFHNIHDKVLYEGDHYNLLRLMEDFKLKYTNPARGILTFASKS